MNDSIALASRRLDRRAAVITILPPSSGLSRAPWHARAASIFTDYFFGFVLALLLALLLAATAQGATPLEITTTNLPNATAGTVYSQTLKATGGKKPYSWSGGSGLPAGLTLDAATGKVTGVPTVQGEWVYTYPFTTYITVTDASSNHASASFTVLVQRQTHTLKVVSGSGSGAYPSNVTVSITAAPPAAGQMFKSWVGAVVADPLSAATTLVMPSRTSLSPPITESPIPRRKPTR